MLASSVALQRDSVELIIPHENQGDLLAGPVAHAQTDQVFILFDDGVVRGTLEWRENVRLSDFVTRQDGFILLRDCTIELGHVLTDEYAVKEASAVLMNVNHIVGISETTPR